MGSPPDNPDFAFNDQLVGDPTRGNDSEIETASSKTASDTSEADTTLRPLLVTHECNHTKDKRRFWPDQLLRSLVTRERVSEELRTLKRTLDGQSLFENGDIESYVEVILGPGGSNTDTKTDIEKGAENCLIRTMNRPTTPSRYLKIFTLLVLCEELQDIQRFIGAELCDEDLPLDLGTQSDLPPSKIRCFASWKTAVKEFFQTTQYGLLVPYFGLPFLEDTGHTVRHADYRPEVILPWVVGSGRSAEGGYGMVTCIRIHQLSHGFSKVEQVQAANNELALKNMTTDKISDFEKESKMLKMFTNHHDHLIKLLMSFSVGGKNYLLFPWAGYDLASYWKSKMPPFNSKTKSMDPEPMKWLSRQINGLTSALDTLHNPPHHKSLSVDTKTYTRHGDIKPENILWFKSNSNSNGSIVIGDLGIASAHRLVSRSNIPNNTVPVSPDYRPPECDQDGGKISRAYDIWTMGCLFLEMVCWALGGTHLLQAFDEARNEVPYIGVMSNIFFDVKKTDGDGSAVILVKEVVVQWMSNLHQHEGCTDYFHDLLDIIHGDMIIVLSKTRERIRSKPLRQKITNLHSKLMENPDYGLVATPRQHSYPAPAAIKTELNQNGAHRFKRWHENVRAHGGRAELAKSALDMSRMD
ncbi:kinase-like protein [Massarina eburnea CBS 473.64]|uniref:Kinase-like protein n=1 Tax=Massarina eburnea CBS 473.64 TaxID=1395130 RepID=A0A6A6RL54_9PLEO|nr:kinase-like protein [Massarina eburnea CBS 473.64]